LPGAGGSLAAGTGGVWVSGSFGIARIDPAAVTLDTPIKIGAAGAAIATTGNAVWVVQRRGGALLRLVRLRNLSEPARKTLLPHPCPRGAGGHHPRPLGHPAGA